MDWLCMLVAVSGPDSPANLSPRLGDSWGFGLIVYSALRSNSSRELWPRSRTLAVSLVLLALETSYKCFASLRVQSRLLTHLEQPKYNRLIQKCNGRFQRGILKDRTSDQPCSVSMEFQTWYTSETPGAISNRWSLASTWLLGAYIHPMGKPSSQTKPRIIGMPSLAAWMIGTSQ